MPKDGILKTMSTVRRKRVLSLRKQSDRYDGTSEDVARELRHEGREVLLDRERIASCAPNTNACNSLAEPAP